jgi:hypothetical protein
MHHVSQRDGAEGGVSDVSVVDSNALPALTQRTSDKSAAPRFCEPDVVKALFDDLQRAPLMKFTSRRGRLIAPKRKGVYVIYNRRGRVVYVGRTVAEDGILQRLRIDRRGRSSFCEHYFGGDGSKLWRGHYAFRYLIVSSARHRALLAAYAIGLLCPAYLGLG